MYLMFSVAQLVFITHQLGSSIELLECIENMNSIPPCERLPWSAHRDAQRILVNIVDHMLLQWVIPEIS